MAKTKITVPGLEGHLIGKEVIPARTAGEMEKDGRKIKWDASPERNALYVLMGNKTPDGLYTTMPKVLTAYITGVAFEAINKPRAVKCTCDLEDGKYTITAIDGIPLAQK